MVMDIICSVCDAPMQPSCSQHPMIADSHANPIVHHESLPRLEVGPIKCAECGRSFMTTDRALQTCSRECAAAYYKNRANRRKAENPC